MDQRVRFVAAVSSCRYTMSELCRVFGISRKTGYKWTRRYGRDGTAGLEDRSRAPKSCPHRTDERCEQALVEARKAHPRWGPKKLLVVVRERHPEWPWPATSTAGQILKRHGLVKPQRRRRRRSRPLKPHLEVKRPNAMWSADFKGQFRLGNTQLCYPLTVADRKTRFLLSCSARSSTRRQQVKPVFERLFEQYGLPDKILTDSGPPFASALALRRLSKLSVWWIRLGIEPVVIEPGHPEQNGRHERMHRTLKADTTRPPARTPRAQQRCFDRFRREYNLERPHEALDMRRPAELYTPSTRPYPAHLPEVTYPGHFELRRVRATGDIKWKGQFFYLSEALRRQTVGLEQLDEHLWSVYFQRLLLGRYDERDRSLHVL